MAALKRYTSQGDRANGKGYDIYHDDRHITRRDDRSMCEETASCIKIQEEKANDIAVIMVGLCWIGAI
jgi:hypothetical protein